MLLFLKTLSQAPSDLLKKMPLSQFPFFFLSVGCEKNIIVSGVHVSTEYDEACSTDYTVKCYVITQITKPAEHLDWPVSQNHIATKSVSHSADHNMLTPTKQRKTFRITRKCWVIIYLLETVLLRRMFKHDTLPPPHDFNIHVHFNIHVK